MSAKILLIDDKKDFPEATAVARSFREGIEKLSTERWDVVMLDYDLGGQIGSEEHGMGVLEWMKEHEAHRPLTLRLVSSYGPAVLQMYKYCKEHLLDVDPQLPF